MEESIFVLYIFQKYIFILPERLIICIFVFTIVQLFHNSLYTAQARFHELYVRWAFYTWFTHTLFAVCVLLLKKIYIYLFCIYIFFFTLVSRTFRKLDFFTVQSLCGVVSKRCRSTNFTVKNGTFEKFKQ